MQGLIAGLYSSFLANRTKRFKNKGFTSNALWKRLMKKTPKTRLFTPVAGISLLVLNDADTMGIVRTLRLKKNDILCCFNGDGMEYAYQVEEAAKRELTLSLNESHPNERDSLPFTRILIAATKGKTKDRMVRDLPPLGASEIAFYRADRSVCLPQEDAQPRLQKIAVEACRQCGRSTIPEVKVIDKPLKDLIESEGIPPSRCLLFWEKCEESVAWNEMEFSDNLTLIFGPEGGFSEEEMEWIRQTGIPLASLGGRILRSELAVVVGTTLAQARRGVVG